MDDPVIELLKEIGKRAVNCKYTCRVTMDDMGIRVNMWTRAFGSYADRNYMIQYEQLMFMTVPQIEVMFKYLETYIDRRLVTLEARQTQNENPV